MSRGERVAPIDALLQTIEAFRLQRVSLEALRAAIWSTVEIIDSYEERRVRRQLQTFEGRLDMVQFTVNGEDTFTEALKIVDALEETLKDKRL